MRPVPQLHLGNYEALLQLATGGMATVFVARQIGAAGFERLVVVKRVHHHLLANREFYDMFRDEARVAAMLHHPNVVLVTDVVESDGELFLVMEYVDSVALSTLLKAAHELGARLPPAVVCRILVDTLSGLHAAHDALDMRGQRLEIVHRDVSPQNVIVGQDGTTRLIDFGVAKARHRLTETKSGSLKGKYGYMSPEQTKAHPVDRRADLFAAGVVFWEALTGERLFRGETEFDTMRRIAEAPIPAPSSVAPSVPRALDAVVLGALERDPARRFQTAHAFIEAIEAACPPVPSRDVAAVVKAYCGERLETRRATLQGMLEGRIEPLSESRMAVASDDPDAPTSVSAPRSKRRLVQDVHDESTEGKIAATHDAPAPRGPARGRWMVGVGAAVGIVAVIAVVALWPSKKATAPPPVVVTVATAPVPSATGAASGAPGTATAAAASASAGAAGATALDEVALQLTADAPIERVSAPGIHDSKLDGTRARLVVARWGGELEVDAVLAGGVAARAIASSDGARELRLVRVAPPDASTGRARSARPPRAGAGQGAPPAGAGGRAGQAGQAGQGGQSGAPPELHENPY